MNTVAHILLDGAMLFIGFVVGRALRRTPPPEPVRPICACDHTFGEHDRDRNCLGETNRAHYLPNGDRNGREWVRCACRHYTGPEPLLEYWAPPPLI